MAAKSDSKHPKVRALLEEGTLNPAPGKVQDPKFHDGEFFDPRDIVQVKYEMLRRVSVDNASVTSATEEYSVSRPTYYQTKAASKKQELPAWCPGSGVHAARTRYGVRCWHLSRSNWSRASPFERASWPSRSGEDSISMSTRGRSSEPSP